MGGSPKAGSPCSSPDQRAQFYFDARAPSPRVLFQTPIATKAGPMPPHQPFMLENPNDRQDRRKPSIHLHEKPAIVVGSLRSTPNPALQDDRLMSEHCILSLKPTFRLERRGEDRHDETQESDHSTSLGDSVSSATRVRRSVHTGMAGANLLWFGVTAHPTAEWIAQLT
jgi:hypothetical protein